MPPELPSIPIEDVFRGEGHGFVALYLTIGAFFIFWGIA